MEVAALGLRVDGTQNIDKATASLNNFSKAGSNAEKSTAGVAAGSQKAKLGVRELSASADNATGALRDLASIGARVGGVLGAAFSINAIKNYADQWSDLQSRVGAATKDMAGAAKQMSRLVDIANASYSSLDQTVSAYAGNVGALQDLGKSAADAADYTESLNHMLVLTATRGEHAASVQNALSKAMAVGKLQAEGLETVLANGGEVAAALAKELGTNVSGLRQLASDGKITGEVIANAIIKALDDVRDRASKMPAIIADAFQRINTNTTELVGVFDKLTGASEAVAGGIIDAADSMRNLSQNAELLEDIAKAGEVLAVVIGSRLVASTVASAAAFTAKAVQAGVATVALKAYEGQSLKTAAANAALAASARTASGAMALLGGPAGLIVTTLGLAALAWSNYGDSARENAGEGVLGLVDTKKEIADLINGFEKLNKIQQQQTIDIKTQDMADAAKAASKAFFDLGNAFDPAMDQGSIASAKFRADFNADIKDVADNTDLSADQMADALVRVIDEYINSGRATEASRKKMLEYAQALATAKGEVNGLRGELAALSNVQGVYTEGMGNSPVVQKQNEALERTVKAAIDATKSFKSTAERVNEVRESSNQAAAALKELEASGRGASDEANILRGRIESANKEIEKLQKGSSGAASSKVKLKSASKDLETQIRREQAAYAQLVEMQQEAADYYVQLSKNQEALGVALDQATLSIQEQSELLDLEERMIGKSNVERQHAIELLQIERDLRKEIDEIDRMDLPGGEASREEARVRARANAAKKIANAERKVYIDSWREINQYVEDSLYDAIVTGGASAKEALQRMFQNLVLRPIVQAAVSGLFGTGTAASGTGAGMMDRLANSGGGFTNWGTWGTKAGDFLSDTGFRAINEGFTGVGEGLHNLGQTIQGWDASLKSVPGFEGGFGSVFGYGQAIYSLSQGNYGQAIGTAIGTYILPGIGTMIGSTLGSLVDGAFGGGTPHGGAAAGYSGGQITDFGKGFTRQLINSDYTSGVQAGVSAVAATVGQSFDALAALFERQGGYRVTTGFSADSDDPAWGRLQIYDAVGSALVDWNAGRYGPKDTRLKSQFSSDPEKAFDQYLQSVAASSLPALKDIAPAWADAMIDGVTQAIGFDGSSWKSITVSGQEAVSAMQSVVQQIALVEAGFASLGNAMSMFSGLSDDMKTALLGGLGGMEALTAAASSYYGTYYSEAERMQTLREQVNARLEELGVSLGNSLDAFDGEKAIEGFRKNLEEAIATGQGELAAAMLSISQEFAATAQYAQKMGQVLRDLQEEQDSINAELLRASGKTKEYEAALRELATRGYTDAERAVWSYNNTLQKQIAVLDQRASLEMQLMQAQGNTAALRAAELAGIDESNHAIQKQIWAIQDQAAAQQRATQRYQEAIAATNAAWQVVQDVARRDIERLQKTFTVTDSVYRALNQAIDAQRDAMSEQMRASETLISTLKNTIDLVKTSATDLRGGASVGSAMQYQAAMNVIRQAAGGMLPERDKLADAISSASAFVKDSDKYSSAFERDFALLSLAAELDKIAANAEPQLTIEEQALEVAKQQLASLDSTLESIKKQIDVMRGLDDRLYEQTLELLGIRANTEQKQQIKLLEELLQSGDAQLNAIASGAGANVQAEALRDMFSQISLNIGNLSTVTDAVERTAAIDSIGALIVKTEEQISAMRSMGVDLKSLDNLDGILSQSKNQLNKLSDIDLNTYVTEKLMQDLINAQREEEASRVQIEGINAQLSLAQKQYDKLNGIYSANVSMVSALNSLAAAMKAQQAAKPTETSGTAPTIDASKAAGNRQYAPTTVAESDAYLAAFPDVAAEWYRMEKVHSIFVSDPAILKKMQLEYTQKHWNEYGRYEGRKYAKGGFYPGGLALVGEEGPELINFARPGQVYTATETQNILRQGSDVSMPKSYNSGQSMTGAQIESLLKSLIADNRQLQQRVITYLMQIDKTTTRWDADGLPHAREEYSV